MSVTRAVREVSTRRVRHQARDAAAVMGVSAGFSLTLSLLLLLVTSLGR
jgi:hypothetical protein